MALNPRDARPLHVQVADDLRQRIASGELHPGEKLPGLKTLAKSYGVAELTAHTAIKELQVTGLVQSTPGRGTFVQTPLGRDLPNGTDETDRRIEALRQDLEDVRRRLDERDDADELRSEVQELRRQHGRLEALLMDLYSRTGVQFPHSARNEEQAPARRRRAAG